MKRLLMVQFLSLLLGWWLIIPAHSQDAETILSRIDSVLNAPKDRVMVEKMTLIDKEGSQKIRRIKFTRRAATCGWCAF
ncbi:MAG: hypothetical protein Q9P14_14730 [candidate division KSB1 bacterium]|nr:hypothetical protein [candidate division KSB1 bacterium]